LRVSSKFRLTSYITLPEFFVGLKEGLELNEVDTQDLIAVAETLGVAAFVGLE